MKSTRWICALAAATFLFASSGAPARAQGHDDDHDQGQGHDKDKHNDDRGRGHDKDKRGDSDRRDDRYYQDRDQDSLRNWYQGHRSHLPPGLAKRDQLPPGLERQLIVRGTLPPGLRGRIRTCPPDLVRVLPPPPPNCQHVIIGGHVVLLNRSNFLVMDVFHFEL